jgi:alkyl hydroperoxide reductase subunit AhpC
MTILHKINVQIHRSVLPLIAVSLITCPLYPKNSKSDQMTAEAVFENVNAHNFHPLNEEGSFTIDRDLGRPGIANPNDEDWRVRLLAMRDLVRIGQDDRRAVEAGLKHPNPQVRYLVAGALGVLGQPSSVSELVDAALHDTSPLVRSQAAIALGQTGSQKALETLSYIQSEDPVQDVRHQAELSVDQINKRMSVTPAFREAFVNLDPSTFGRPQAGSSAPHFTLLDTEDQPWHLGDHLKDQWVVLIWIFADWCPVCHREFNEMIDLREEFKSAGVLPVTLEIHDRYRARVMVGKEVDPKYWFAKESFQQTYTEQIWWPHLRDNAGAVGAVYGIDPMAYAVHSEYINRPSVFIIDPQGVIRFAYRGTYWGDRPSMHEILGMIRTGTFAFEHPKRLQLPVKTAFN